jgi:HrpA-like RNA helicase
MIALAHQSGCLPYAIAIVAALSVQNPFVKPIRNDETDDDEVGTRRETGAREQEREHRGREAHVLTE